jgi:hypothetical protein
VYGGPNTQATDGRPWGYTGATVVIVRSSQQATTYSPFDDDLFTGVYLNRRSSYDEERDRRWRDTREALRKALEAFERSMRAVHRPPPVAVDLASLPMPTPPVNARAAGAGWHRRAHGGPRERASHRRRLRVWERAAYSLPAGP